MVKVISANATVSNSDYVAITKSTLNSIGINSSYIVNIYMERNPNYGYHFIRGYGVENNSGTLFIYFDGAINQSVYILIYHIPV